MTRHTPLWTQDGAYAASVDRRLPAALWPTARTNGLEVTVQPGTTTVNIATGDAAVPTANNTGSVLCSSTAVEQLEMPPAGAEERTDVVVVYPRGDDIGGDAAPASFTFAYLMGQPGQPAPDPPAGQWGLAEIRRPAGSAAIVAADITDIRPGGLAVPPTSGPTGPPRGFVARSIGPASVLAVGTTLTTILTLTATTYAGRRYRLDCFAFINATVSGQPIVQVDVANLDTAQGRFLGVGLVNLTGFLPGAASFMHSPTTTAQRTWTMSGQMAGSGSMNVAANQQFMLLEDIGAQ